jgi:lipopolysaccharide transport system ATP-binding protein
MAAPIITVENLGKTYKLGLKEEKYPTFREALAGAVRAPIRRLRHMGSSSSHDETFWALKDVSFEVQRGEVVGIIGRNGAGKSTLLKILSRITEPTTGRAVLRGRVASLLEVGTGFHPELTGRENIYLNGSILGMKKVEIDRRFDEIVSFAEVEKFLDTPVKHYSSGMYVRLAFAVAAHLEPEILIVDEVLAVGDAQFQKKCLGKMHDVAEHDGRTVLFVSHNMGAVRVLCGKGLVLSDGTLDMCGTASDAVASYISSYSPSHYSGEVCFPSSRAIEPRMCSARVRGESKAGDTFEMGESIQIEVDYASTAPLVAPRLGLVISDDKGAAILNANNRYQRTQSEGLTPRSKHHGTVRCDLGKVPFQPGAYFISLWFGSPSRDTHREENALSFNVVSKDLWGTGQLPPQVTPLWWPCDFSWD